MDLSSKNEAYRNYVEQGKEAFSQGDIQRAKTLFLKAAEITNQITLESTSVDVKNEYYRVTQTLLDFVKKNCSTTIKVAVKGDAVQEEKTINEENIEKLSIEEALDKLNSLTGLETVKESINDWVRQIQVFQKRKSKGLKVPDMSYHMVFTGNPGTGKTTVARIVGQIYCALGIVSKGHLVEVDRSKLVAAHIGGTEERTSKLVKEALGGVLFVDEAYMLAQGGDNDFGTQAIATLLKAMEDNRNDLAVIVAGYDDLMQEFIDSNPGLASRFKTYIHFDDYKPEELINIFLSLCKSNDYMVSDELMQYLSRYFEVIYHNRDKNFGNGRDVRNLFEKTITKQSKRIFSIKEPTAEEMMLLKCEDIDS